MITYLYIFGIPKDKKRFLELLKLLGDNEEWTEGSINSFINSHDVTGIQYSVHTGSCGFVYNDEYKEWNKKVSYDEILMNQHNLENLTHWGLESTMGDSTNDQNGVYMIDGKGASESLKDLESSLKERSSDIFVLDFKNELITRFIEKTK